MSARLVAGLMVLGVLASCGGERDSRDAAPAECPALDPDDPVTLQVPYGDAELAREWDAQEPGVELDLREGASPLAMAVSMADDDPHALTSFPSWMTPTVEAADIVTTSTACFPATQLYIGGWLLAYDRAAFARAGLDPDAPPATLDELYEIGVALRDRADMSSPISWDPVPVALFELDVATVEAERAARAWTRLGVEGLLHERQPDTLPPLGSGEAAIQVLWSEDVWAFANAIAEGQAPHADIDVAPVPGVDGPQSTYERFDWVVSPESSAAVQVAAAEFLRWLGEPAPLLRIHREHGLLPADPSAVTTAEFRSYWADRPLLAATWDVVQGMPEKPAYTKPEASGDWRHIAENLRAVARGDLDFETAWDAIVDVGRRVSAATKRDPLAMLRCTAGRPDSEPPPVIECV